MPFHWRAVALTVAIVMFACGSALATDLYVEVPLAEPEPAAPVDDAVRPQPLEPLEPAADPADIAAGLVNGEGLELPEANLILTGGDCGAMLEALAATYLPDGPVLTLDEAISLTVENSAELASLALEVDAGLARQVQAGLRENPELDIGLSEFVGWNERRGFRSSVSSVTYSKLIEHSCKRAGRIDLARSEVEVARWNYEVRLREIQLGVATSYVEVLVSQYELAVLHELLRLAEVLRQDVALRYEAGTVPLLSVKRIDVEIANARLAVEQAERELEATRRRLSSHWGELAPGFILVQGSIADTPVPPAIEALVPLLEATPGAQLFEYELRRREAGLTLAEANAEKDYRVRGGLEGFGDSGEMALTVGITIPLVRENRNQGAIAEAEVLIEQVGEQRLAHLQTLQVELIAAHSELVATYGHADAICQQVIPAAQETYEGMLFGYRHGKFENIELLDSERVLVEALAAYVEALGNFQRSRATVERLIAAPIDAVLAPEPGEFTVETETEVEVEVEAGEAAAGIEETAGEIEPATEQETITVGEGNG
jgi:cobalt-zinc-cadmium efflux system outer membrane protein